MERQDHGIIGNIARQPIAFLVVFGLFLFLTVSFLGYMDVLPQEEKASGDSTVKTVATKVTEILQSGKVENPSRIKISKLGIDVHIENPESTKVSVLDQALLKGAVRYPTSNKLGENGTVLLFGHSSNLPVIHNQAYKAFKGIQNLSKGDTVSVYSATHEYRYQVDSVELADANEDVIELPRDGKYLKLVTCDTFSKKSARFVVSATFVGAYPLISQ